MSDLDNNPESVEQEQPLFSDKQLEYINSLLKSTKEEANKAANGVDKRVKTEIATLQATIESLKQSKATLEAPTEVTDTPEPETLPKSNNSVSAVRKELEERLAAERAEWQKEVEAIKAERDAEKKQAIEQKQAAFKANLRKEVYKQLSAEGFEDVEEAMDFLFLKNSESKFEMGEEGMLLYKASDDESFTLQDVLAKFKDTPGGRRFLPAPSNPQGVGLPKSGNNKVTASSTPPTGKELAQQKLTQIRAGKAQLM